MWEAIDQAEKGVLAGEVPIGALVIDQETGLILSRAHNVCISQNDPTGHAEIVALRMAAQKKQNYRLPGTVMVVTIEPCIMCLGAIINSRVSGVVFGACDPKAGAIVSRIDMAELHWVNHKPWFIDGILEQECSDILKSFFKKKRE